MITINLNGDKGRVLIMFNGIIFKTGKVKEIIKKNNSIYVGIQTKINFSKKDLGSSICCDGVCLTIEKIVKKIYFYISNETLNRTNFKTLKLNQIINLEKSISFGKDISGHFIQGHVDTVAKIKKIKFIDKAWIINFEIIDKRFNKYLIEKAFLLMGYLLLFQFIKNHLKLLLSHTH